MTNSDLQALTKFATGTDVRQAEAIALVIDTLEYWVTVPPAKAPVLNKLPSRLSAAEQSAVKLPSILQKKAKT